LLRVIKLKVGSLALALTLPFSPFTQTASVLVAHRAPADGSWMMRTVVEGNRFLPSWSGMD